MSLPRQILAKTFYMITRRCAQRQYLLRPDDAANAIFLYCLAEAAERFGIEVVLPSVMSDHHHTIVFDRYGRIVEFTEHLHKLIARAMNALRGRRENFWSSEAVSLVRMIEISDVIDKLVYAASNPVKDGLVDRVHHWPGVNGLSALLNDRLITIRRPRHFFRKAGKMPKEVTLRLVIPPELGEADEIRRVLRERIAAVEEEQAKLRAASGGSVLGRRAVLEQTWRAYATSEEPRGGLNPRVAARRLVARWEALARDREFVATYRECRKSWLRGIATVFPAGTYWLRRFAGVAVAAAVT